MASTTAQNTAPMKGHRMAAKPILTAVSSSKKALLMGGMLCMAGVLAANKASDVSDLFVNSYF